MMILCLLNFITVKGKIGHSEYIDTFLGFLQGRLGFTVVNFEHLCMIRIEQFYNIVTPYNFWLSFTLLETDVGLDGCFRMNI